MPAVCCCDESCAGGICVVLFDTCTSARAAGWHVTITDPSGVVVFDGPGLASGDCSAAYGLGPHSATGTYSIVATKTVNLSAEGGPSAYTMTFSGSVAVTDPCASYSLTIDVCEDWLVLSLPTGCFYGLGGMPTSCNPGSSVTVTTDLGTFTATGDRTNNNVVSHVFTGFGCGHDTVNWSVAVNTPGTMHGNSGVFTRCPPNLAPQGSANRVKIFPTYTVDSTDFCTGCCNWPLPKILHYTDSSGVSVDCTSTGGDWMGTASNGSSPDTINPTGYEGCCHKTGGTYTCLIVISCNCDPFGGLTFTVTKWWYICEGTAPDGLGCCPGEDCCANVGNQVLLPQDKAHNQFWAEATVAADCGEAISLTGTLVFSGSPPLVCNPSGVGDASFLVTG
jgi:hypothetical protein